MTRGPRRAAGFALLETLVALLLFALGLAGACATLVASLRATHQALLAGRAADLAADYVEDLHAAAADADFAALLGAAQQRANGSLPAPARDTALELMRIGGAFRATESP